MPHADNKAEPCPATGKTVAGFRQRRPRPTRCKIRLSDQGSNCRAAPVLWLGRRLQGIAAGVRVQLSAGQSCMQVVQVFAVMAVCRQLRGCQRPRKPGFFDFRDLEYGGILPFCRIYLTVGGTKRERFSHLTCFRLLHETRSSMALWCARVKFGYPRNRGI